ncbi:ATP-binding cassette domain-containing protein [Cupriavidus numazuensis]|uniref:Type I secretion system ATP-binding protein PrsD n=1 Tax=Cupriavidus numazuensis TaxID=221992 RepID=A0ABN7Q8W6_9BURK|nr:ATP-binding cassette domain-containing protein [Cupriavidus numazuensis]CAG2158491.1 Type I secretion system ATP-binding protein PrsD [Cupriavidus numazuensis]
MNRRNTSISKVAGIDLQWPLGLVVIFSVFGNLAALVPSLFLLQVYDRVLSSRSIETLWMLVFISILAYLLSFGLEYARGLILADTALHFGVACRSHSDKYLLLSLAGGQSATGAALPNDMRTAEAFLSGPGLPLLLDAPWGLFFLLVVFAFDARLGLVALGGLFLMVLVAYLDKRLVARKMEAASESQALAERADRELQLHAITLLQMGGTRELVAAHSALRLREQLAGTALVISLSFYRLASKAVMGGLQTAMLTAGAILVINSHASGGIMLAATLLLGKVLQPLQPLAASWQSISNGLTAFLRLHAWLQQPNEDTKPMTPATADLIVDALGFGYPNTSCPVLMQASFRLAGGELLIIRGASGSGKTTLARLLSGMYRPHRGAVTLDAKSTYTVDRVGGNGIGLLAQDAAIFSGTIAQNIGRTMHGGAQRPAQQALECAAKMVGIHEWILSLPLGYETPIGSDGHHLTYAETRFIELARSVYWAPKLIVLDEPATRLDEAWRTRLQLAIERMLDSGMAVVICAIESPFPVDASQLAHLRGGTVLRESQLQAPPMPISPPIVASRVHPLRSVGAPSVPGAQ